MELSMFQQEWHPRRRIHVYNQEVMNNQHLHFDTFAGGDKLFIIIRGFARNAMMSVLNNNNL